MFCSNMQCWVFLKLSKMRQFFQGHIIIVTWKMQCYSNKVLMTIMVHYRNIFYIELQFWKFEAHFSLTLNSTNSIWIYCKNVISWVFSLDGWRCRGVGSATILQVFSLSSNSHDLESSWRWHWQSWRRWHTFYYTRATLLPMKRDTIKVTFFPLVLVDSERD